MIKVSEEQLLGNDNIRRAKFNGEHWFSVDDVAEYLKEDLNDVETLQLPIGKGGQPIKCATVGNINKGRKQESLSDFNKKLLRARDYKPKKK